MRNFSTDSFSADEKLQYVVVLKYASDLTCSSIKNYTVDGEVMVYMAFNGMEALYENSKPFSNFLKKQGLEALLKKTNLKLREKHKIFPHVRSVRVHSTFCRDYI